jgi:agmatine/peptidylarginine deiminase
MLTDDTWARDHGPLGTFQNGVPSINDFTFNGWGGKFYSHNDNVITRNLFFDGAFRPGSLYFSHDWVLEGGSIETDGEGTILTTSRCLLNNNRNGTISREQAEEVLKESLGAERILWLDHGHLEGDDTDSHIDTLARFCNRDTICYVSCNDVNDPHYLSLKKMEQQLQGFRTNAGKPYSLVPLPMVPPQFDDEGKRLPATYANFLIINGAVLLPVYGVKEDSNAAQVMKVLFQEREIVSIDCSSLIKQYGSLHCVTMQIPKGFLP